MSFNQSRSDKSESQYRKGSRSGSSGQQRGFSGGGGKGGGGTAPPPTSSSNTASALSANRSFKKSNGQGGQSRVSTTSANLESKTAAAPRIVQNGVHVQPPLHGSSDAPVSGVAAKPIDPPTHRTTRAVPRAPSSQSSGGAVATTTPTTPAKGDVSKTFQLQFGSINASFVNGMQIPARTSSAPPNLHEQKLDQARHDSFRAEPTRPIPSVPKHQQPKKDVASIKQSSTGESHSSSQTKRDMQPQAPSAPAAIQAQKSPVIPITGISMPMPFQQSQVPIQFGGPNSRIQSQGVTAASLQMPMPLPIGNATQMQQQLYVPGLQSHSLPPPGLIHQSQGLSFGPQMGHQLAPQMGNLTIGMNPQFAQQQAGKSSGPRKAVKITHPETHEELRLDKRVDSYMDAGSSGLRSQNNLPPQSQPIPSFAPPHQINYYSPVQPNSYNPPSIYYQNPTSLPLTSTQMTSGSPASRFNYPVGQGAQAGSFMNPSSVNTLHITKTGPPMHGIAELSNPEHPHDSRTVTSAPASVQVTVKPAPGSYGEKIGSSSVSMNSPIVSKGELPKLRSPGEASSFHPQKDSEIQSESSMQQSRTLPEVSAFIPSHVSAKNSAVPSAAISTERVSSNSSASAPPDETVSVLPNNEGRRRETVRRSDSLKDHQKKLNKKDIRHSQALHQVEASDSTGSSKSSSLKASMDVVKSADNIQASPSQEVVGSSITNLSMPSQDLDSCSSLQDGISEIMNVKTILAPAVICEGMLEPIGKPLVDIPDASEALTDSVELGEASTYESTSRFGTASDGSGAVRHAKQGDHILQVAQLNYEPIRMEEGKTKLPEGPKLDESNCETLLGSVSSQSAEVSKQSDQDTCLKATGGNELGSVEAEQREPMKESVGGSLEIDRTTENLVRSSTTSSDSIDAETASGLVSSVVSNEDRTSTLDICKSINSQEVVTTDHDVINQELDPVPALTSSLTVTKVEARGFENTGSEPIATQVSASKDKLTSEPNRSKNTTTRVKKKRKEILQKADAAGTTSDLYMAYKGPEEKRDAIISSDSLESSTGVDVKQITADAIEKDAVASEDDRQSKAELDDWEDAADISTPQLKTSDNGEQVNGDEDPNGVMGKKRYSRDFLLTFSEQCTDLPAEFEITADIAETLMAKVVLPIVDRESYASSGRIIDRPSGVSRPERRGTGMMDDDKWSKSPGPFAYSKDPRLEIGHGGNVIGVRPGQGGNHGVLRNPRGQVPGQYVGGILSVPMQAVASQGGQRNNSDADRWQRATVIQRGLIPSPQTPLQVMHKAERKYEVGKVSDEEEAKQRQLKAILNKLTPQNFDKLFVQVKEVNIENVGTLTGVISQIFDKALTEPTFCEMYANFCCHLAGELPDFSEDNEKITFKRLLLNKCQEEFERGEREQAEANRVEEEGGIKQSAEQREEKRINARRRMLGNIRLIGELYKKKMLTERIMHECIKKLLGQYQNPDEEDVEALCKLMSTIGEMIDHPKAKEHMDAYFDMMAKLATNMKLSSRVRFMLRDAIELRKNKWQQRRKVDGPKKIEEVHRDAAQERQAQTSRLARGSGINSSSRRGQPMDFGLRGSSMLASPNVQMGFRGTPSQIRGYGMQDARLDERNPYESRTLSVPLPQRPIDDETITLGPQGGLARGMSTRGQPLMPTVPLADISANPGDTRRIAAGPNGYNSASEWIPYSSREEHLPRYTSERFMGPPAYDQPSSQERSMYFGNRDTRTGDRSFDRSMEISPAPRLQGSAVPEKNVHSDKVLPEEHLRDMSIKAIREFYSAQDEKEVASCIKDLNTPSFYPSMISIWVTDSFEMKDFDRGLLAKLLVNLTRARDGILSQIQLIKGFESVLATLEDAVSDAPKAAEYLGIILANIILANVIPLKEIGRLISKGGEEPGRLIEIGLASEVLGGILEIIKKEKGEDGLNEIRTSSSLKLEDFRPPDPTSRWKKLDAYL